MRKAICSSFWCFAYPSSALDSLMLFHIAQAISYCGFTFIQQNNPTNHLGLHSLGHYRAFNSATFPLQRWCVLYLCSWWRIACGEARIYPRFQYFLRLAIWGYREEECTIHNCMWFPSLHFRSWSINHAHVKPLFPIPSRIHLEKFSTQLSNK